VRPSLCGGALERALVEHLPALRADRSLDLVRDAEPLRHRVGESGAVLVGAWAPVGEELGHRPRFQRRYPIGSYDAKKGDEIVEIW
jgi:hypothetical protein